MGGENSKFVLKTSKNTYIGGMCSLNVTVAIRRANCKKLKLILKATEIKLKKLKVIQKISS